MAALRTVQEDRGLERERAARETLRRLGERARSHDFSGFCPLGRAAFLLVFFGELALRWLSGQPEPGDSSLPLLHGFLAWGAAALFRRLVDVLHGLLCAGGGGKAPGLRFPRNSLLTTRGAWLKRIFLRAK
ncbi:MAG: hypothetical protein KKA55_10715 [Proteobacteria bacterium]|nr:hypothetical protein [Pseudomonadota bacterium]MBU1595990.1 hypothetical protein [Pseudomonadota bacterium]